jgi:hypothetical protein
MIYTSQTIYKHNQGMTSSKSGSVGFVDPRRRKSQSKIKVIVVVEAIVVVRNSHSRSSSHSDNSGNAIRVLDDDSVPELPPFLYKQKY